MFFVQILIVIFALFALSRAVLRIKDNEITIGEFLMWSFVWTILIVFAFIPSFMTEISDFIGIGRGVDLLVYGGLILGFYMIFKIYVKMENIQQEITSLTRTIALTNQNEKRTKTKKTKK